MTEEKKYAKPKMRRHPGAWRNRIKLCWPFLVWLAVLAAVIYLFTSSDETGRITGVVETTAEPVAPLSTARLLAIEVAVGDKVKAGDIVARMDTSLLDAQLAAVKAQMLEIEGNITGFSQNMLQMVRQFETAINNSEAQLEALKTAWQSDIAKLAELKKEQARRESLVADKLITRQEATMLLPEIAALEKTVSAYPELIKLNETHLKEAKAERKYLSDAMKVEEGEDINAAIRRKMKARLAILDASMAREKVQLDSYTLRATRDGVVSRIYHAPGDVVNAGDPVLRLVSENSNHVAGFLPENYMADFKLGQNANVYRQTRKGGAVSATVESVGPEVLALPGRISPIRGRPLRGRRVVLILKGEHDLIPGETVMICKELNGNDGLFGRFFRKEK